MRYGWQVTAGLTESNAAYLTYLYDYNTCGLTAYGLDLRPTLDLHEHDTIPLETDRQTERQRYCNRTFGTPNSET